VAIGTVQIPWQVWNISGLNYYQSLLFLLIILFFSETITNLEHYILGRENQEAFLPGSLLSVEYRLPVGIPNKN